jgi:InsA N-terminal domain
MVTITVHCPHCQSDALVRNGHAPHGKQLSRCRSCGRQSRENPTPHAYPEARREEILHASQERSSLRGLTRTFGVSRTTVSSWIKKKELSFLPYVPPWWLPIPTMLLPPHWNWMSSGRLCSTKPTTPGCGLPCAARHGKWSRMRLGIAANRRVSGCGRPFQTAIARGTASPTSGQHTLQ